MTARTTFLSIILAATTAFAAETEWSQFRGAGGQGISAATNVPQKWSASEGVTWKVELAGKGWSSPVLSKGRLYLTSAVGEPGQSDVTLHAMCLDAKDGRTLWDTVVFNPDAAITGSIHRKNSLASPTPIVTDDRLYVHFGHMGTAALDLAGKVVWKQNGLKYPPIHGNGGSPALVGDALIFSCDGAKEPFVVALDAATGNVRWKTPRNTTAKKTFSFCTPLPISLGGTTQIILPGSGIVGAYDPKDGHEIWRVAYGEGYSLVPRPVFAHGLLFIATGFDIATILAIRPEGAKGDATATNVAWTIKKGAPLSASVIVAGDELYFVSDVGIATCADARTGNVHWSERLSGNYSASPVLAEGRVYFLNETGTTSVLKAGKKFEVLSKNELGAATLASPVMEDGAIYIRTEKHVWKLGARS